MNLPLKNIMFADVMAERLDLPVFVDNDANVAALAEHRAGAARGCNVAVVLTIGTGIGGGLILGGELYRGAVGAAAELGHVVIERDGPPCQGNCPNHGLRRGAGVRHRARARGAAGWRHERPSSGLGRAQADGRELAGPLVTELAHDGDEAAIEAIAAVGSQARSRARQLRQHLQSRGDGDRRRRDRRRRAAARRRRARRSPSGHCRPRATRSRSSPAAFGVEAGMIGAAALAFDGLAATGAGGMSTGRLIICPTPIGNLEDVTLRVLAALREADIVACEDTRRTRVLLDRYGVRR